MNDIFILNDNHQLYDMMKQELPYYTGEVFSSNGLDHQSLVRIAKMAGTEYFYVVLSSAAIFDDGYRFDYRPDENSKDLLHVWGDKMLLRLYRTSAVLQNPNLYTDQALCAGEVKLKHMDDVIYVSRPYDIVFLSYKESNLNDKWKSFKEKYPRAIHVSGVKGIMEAHRAAANAVGTDMFYVVDADANVCPDFKFDYVPAPGQEKFVHVWRSYNHSINLSYGYGGIKLFPTMLIRQIKTWNLDFTTSVNTGFVLVTDVSNETVINDTVYNAWKSAFRECVKLSSSMMPSDTKSIDRLRAWLAPNPNSRYHQWVKLGAEQGKRYGETHSGNQTELMRINDYDWLEKRFALLTDPNKTYYQYYWELRQYADHD